MHRPPAARRRSPIAPLLVALVALAVPAVAAADGARSRPAPARSSPARTQPAPSVPRVDEARSHAAPRAHNPLSQMLPPYIPGSNSIPYRSDRHRFDPRDHHDRPPVVHGFPQVFPVYVPVEPAYDFYAPAPAPPPVVVVVEAPRPAPVPPPPPPVTPPPPPPPTAPKDTGPGEVWLQIVPADARVELDGRALGSAAELSDPDEPLVLAAGVYVLEVTHPGHPAQRLMFAAGSRTPVLIEVDLAESRPRRRARLTTPDDLPLPASSRR